MKNPSLSASGSPLYSPADYKAKLEECFKSRSCSRNPNLPLIKELTYGRYRGIFYRRTNEFATIHRATEKMTPFTREEFRDELLRIVAEVDPAHALRVAAALI